MNARWCWPLWWAGLTLIGAVAGGWTARQMPMPAEQTRRSGTHVISRLATLSPLVLAVTPHPVAAGIAALTAAGGGFWCGFGDARARLSRQAVDAERRWLPSRRVGWQVGAVLRITSWPRERPSGWVAPAVIVQVGQKCRGDCDRGPRRGDGIYVRGEGPAPRLWSLMAGAVEGRLPAQVAVPGGFDLARYLAGRGLQWEGRIETKSPDLGAEEGELTDGDILSWLGARALDPLRQSIIDKLNHGMPTRESHLLASVLLGERDTLSSLTREPFARLGLAHLFAVSGLHVGIILAILTFMMRPLFLPPLARWTIGLAILPLYVLLTGMSGSVLRAAGLALMVMAAPVFGRRFQPLYALGLLFWLNYQIAPWSIQDTGCRLSYLAAVGIVGTHRLAGHHLSCRRRWLGWLFSGLLVTVSAQWFTLPEIAQAFGWINPLAPLANLVAVPIFTSAVWLGVSGLMVQAVSGWLGDPLLALCWLLLRLLAAGAGLCSQAVPVVGIPPLGPLRLAGLLVCSAGIIWQLVRLNGSAKVTRRSVGLSCLALAAVFAGLLPLGRSTGRGRMAAMQFDVGQGDCGLLSFPDGVKVMVDTGGAWPGGSSLGWSVKPWLVREGIRRLDAVVLTHGHGDHTGGVADLLDATKVGVWYLGGSAAELRQTVLHGRAVAHVDRGDTLHRCGEWSLVCLHPPEEQPESWHENDRSIVLALLRGQRWVAIWSGDLEQTGEREVRRWLGTRRTQQLQVWKAGHHGSKTSGCDQFLGLIHPRLTLISCGVENRYRHPSHGPYIVGADTIPVLRSDLDGSVLLRWDESGRLNWSSTRGEKGRITAAAPSDHPGALIRDFQE